MNAQVLSRTLLAYAVALPLAVGVGYALTDPLDTMNFLMVAGVGTILGLPLLIRWWHPLVFFCWNSGLVFAFLPGTPPFWVAMAGVGLGIAVLNRVLDKSRRFMLPRGVTLCLLALLAVALVTAQLRGGIGIRALGGAAYGGKRYIYIIAAVMGYFVFASQLIDAGRLRTYLRLFFLPGAFWLVGNLALMAGPAMYWVFMVVPIDFAVVTFRSMATGSGMVRMGGYSMAAMTAFYYLMARYGVAGLTNWRHPLRTLALAAVLAASVLGGFRSVLLHLSLVFAIQLCLEGLHRARLALGLLVSAAALVGCLFVFSDKMPFVVQRAFSFLPIEVSPAVRQDAESSLRWRTEMWQVMAPELPKYFWLGKGFVMDPAEIYLMQHAQMRGIGKDYEGSLLAGDYHNGPLSVYVPLGAIGLVLFLMFLFLAGRLLYRHYRLGDPRLRVFNAFMLAYFLAKSAGFLILFGDFSTDLALFVGIIGMSVAFNGAGERKSAVRPALPSVLWKPQNALGEPAAGSPAQG